MTISDCGQRLGSTKLHSHEFSVSTSKLEQMPPHLETSRSFWTENNKLPGQILNFGRAVSGLQTWFNPNPSCQVYAKL